jgi:hypothetical protein
MFEAVQRAERQVRESEYQGRDDGLRFALAGTSSPDGCTSSSGCFALPASTTIRRGRPLEDLKVRVELEQARRQVARCVRPDGPPGKGMRSGRRAASDLLRRDADHADLSRAGRG